MRKHIVYSRLNDNRIIGMAVYKLKSIPHFLLLGDNQFESILYDNKKVFSDLLSEFHQITNYTDACIELDWLNEAQNTTALQSKISIYLIIRLTDYTLENIQNKFDEIDKIVHLNLDFQKYNIELSDYPFESYFSMNLEINQMWAIRKKENILFMQNGLINQVYEFDMINDVANELDSLVNFFLNNNKAIFSLQLIPVRLYNEEYAFLEQITNNLSNLLNGISVPKYGLIRDPLVEKPLSVYKTYLNNNAGFYVMNAVVLGRNGLVNNLSSRVMLEFARKNNEGYSPRMDITLVNNGCSDMANYPFIYPWVISEKIMASNRILTFDKYNNFLYRLTSFITPLEASTLFRLPIGTKKITAGFDIIEIEKRSKNYASNILEEADIVLGELQNVVGSNANIGFKLKDLTKHMLVVGTPGSGKSTLLKMIAGMERIDKGDVFIKKGAKVAYLDQVGSSVDDDRPVYLILRDAFQELNEMEIIIVYDNSKNLEEEKEKLLKEKENLESSIARREKLLSNEGYVTRAPKAIVDKERESADARFIHCHIQTLILQM